MQDEIYSIYSTEKSVSKVWVKNLCAEDKTFLDHVLTAASKAIYKNQAQPSMEVYTVLTKIGQYVIPNPSTVPGSTHD